MYGFNFIPGTRFSLDGDEYVVERINLDGTIQVQARRTMASHAATRDHLLAAYSGARLEFIASMRASKSGIAERDQDALFQNRLAMMTEEVREEVKRKLEYVKALDKAGISSHTVTKIRPVIKAVAKKRGDKKPAGASSVLRWQKLLRDADGDVRVLIPNYARRGNRHCRLHPQVYDLARKAVAEKYLVPHRASRTAAHKILCGLIGRYNKKNPDDQLPLPSKKVIDRVINEITPYERDVARHGAEKANKLYRAMMSGVVVTRIGERYELDHTLTDLFVFDEVRRLPLGRAWLTVVIDVYSRYPVGYYIGFEPPSDASVIACLKHAFLPKANFKDENPECANSWEAYGICEELVVDNDVSHHGRALEDACLALSITITYAKVKHPWYKPKVERFFGTLAKDLLHQQPGTTFSNLLERDEYDPAKHAVIGLDDLKKLFNKWVVDDYGCSINRTLQDSPRHKWIEGGKLEEPCLPPSPAALNVILGKVDERVIEHDGVHINNLSYNSRDLEEIRKRHGIRVRTKIKWDPNDLGHIHVCDPGTNEFVRVEVVPAMKDYATGLTLFQHCVLRRFQRLQAEANSPVEDVYEAKLQLNEMVEEIIQKGGRRRTRKKEARFLGIEHDRKGDEKRHAVAATRALRISEPAKAIIDATPVVATNRDAETPTDISCATNDSDRARRKRGDAGASTPQSGDDAEPTYSLKTVSMPIRSARSRG